MVIGIDIGSTTAKSVATYPEHAACATAIGAALSKTGNIRIEIH